MAETLGGVAFFFSIVAVVWAILHFRYKAKARSADVVQSLIENDKDVTPEIIKAIGFVPKRSHLDLRNGMILVAIGIAFILFGGVIPDAEGKAAMAGIAMFPTLIGIALLIFWFAISRKDSD